MKIKHTPGPWIAIIDNPLSVIPGHSIKAAEGSNLPVAIVHEHNGCKGPAEGVANAHLVAAAPELLVRLQNLIDTAVAVEGGRNHVVASINVREARALIARIKKGGA